MRLRDPQAIVERCRRQLATAATMQRNARSQVRESRELVEATRDQMARSTEMRVEGGAGRDEGQVPDRPPPSWRDVARRDPG
jgi:hypothetical protein